MKKLPLFSLLISLSFLIVSCNGSNSNQMIDSLLFEDIYVQALSNLSKNNKVTSSYSYKYDDTRLFPYSLNSLAYYKSIKRTSEIELFDNFEYCEQNNILTKDKNNISEESYMSKEYVYLKAAAGRLTYSLCSQKMITKASMFIQDNKIIIKEFATDEDANNKFSIEFLKATQSSSFANYSFTSTYKNNDGYYGEIFTTQKNIVDNVLYPDDPTKRVETNTTSLTKIFIKEINNKFYINNVTKSEEVSYLSDYNNNAIKSGLVSIISNSTNYYYNSLNTGVTLDYPKVTYEAPKLVATCFNKSGTYVDYDNSILNIVDTTNYFKNIDPAFTGFSYNGFMKIKDEDFYYSITTRYLLTSTTPIYDYIGYQNITKESIVYDTIENPHIEGRNIFSIKKGTYAFDSHLDSNGNVLSLNIIYVGN